MVRQVASDLAGGTASEPLRRSFEFGVHRYLARAGGFAAERVAGPVGFVEATTTEDAYWEMAWTDVAPGDLCWHEPLARVEGARDGAWAPATYDGRPVDDQGWRIGITYDGPQQGTHRYRVCWYGPPLGRPGRHRFVLLANNGRPEVAGPPFD